MTMTTTKQHLWVKHTITPVSVIHEGGRSKPVIFVDPDQQIIAEDGAAYGCDVCGQPMINTTLNTECKGDEDEDN